MLDLELVTAPEAELVTIEELKAHLRVDSADHDEFIIACRDAAVAHLDGFAGILGRGLAEQEWCLYLDRFPAGRIRLPLPPLLAVSEITYVDAAGDSQTLTEDDDFTVLAGARAEVTPVYGSTWPSVRCQPRAVAITFTCGWAAPEDGAAWPAKLQPAIAAVKLMVGDLFANRESGVVGEATAEVKTSLTVERLLTPLRIPRL